MKPPLHSPEFDAARQAVNDFIQRHYANQDAAAVDSDFDDLWKHLVATEWSRAALYQLVGETLEQLPRGHLFDLLDGYESGLLGNCSVEYFEQLSGEPEDVDALINYIRSHEWMRDEGGQG